MMRTISILLTLLVAAQSAQLQAKEQKAIVKKVGGLLARDEPKKVDLNKPMPLKAQEQGYSGKQVQHVDMKTQIGDWQKEYGPNGAAKGAHHHSGSIQGSAVAA